MYHVLFQMISDLNTYLNKAVPDTKLTIKKYLDAKFEYLVRLMFWLELLNFYTSQKFEIINQYVIKWSNLVTHSILTPMSFLKLVKDYA